MFSCRRVLFMSEYLLRPYSAGITKNEGFTVYTLTNRGVLLMCTYLDLVKSTVVFISRMVSALSYTAFDTLVRVILIHHVNTIPLKYLKSFDFEYIFSTQQCFYSGINFVKEKTSRPI